MTTSTDLLFLVGGLALLLAAALPRLARGRAFSPPMVFVLLGLLLGWLPLDLPPLVVGPGANEDVAFWSEHLTEVVVIVALFGVGLAMDRPFSWRRWRSTWWLLGAVMPLSIALVALAGWAVAGLVPAAALLVGAVLAPTDPVLASEVQVGAPARLSRDEDEVRFGLTSEAGLNDGLAFPFVYAAIFLASAPLAEWGLRWVAWELVGKVALGVLLGLVAGWVLARLVFTRRLTTVRFAGTAEALPALAGVFLAYGLAEVAGGYGFLAVFVAALVLRSYERDDEYHEVLHSFVEQVERLLTLTVLLVLGYACSHGLLSGLSWQAALVSVLLVLVIRPLVGWVSLRRLPVLPAQRLALAFFGVRGVGSLYYLAYATNLESMPALHVVWATVAFTVLLSVLLHGVSAASVMDWVDRQARAAQR